MVRACLAKEFDSSQVCCSNTVTVVCTRHVDAMTSVFPAINELSGEEEVGDTIFKPRTVVL